MQILRNSTIGIVGAGKVVFTSHLPVLVALGSQPKWILDASKESARMTAEAYQIPSALSPEELDKTTATDIILVACPYGARNPYYEYFRDKGGALYIEKPVARSLQEHCGIAGLREDFAVSGGFIRRSMGITNVVKGLIEDEVFGRLRHVCSDFGRMTGISTGAAFARHVSLSGGGQLFESAIHNIDAVCYMAGIKHSQLLKKIMIHEDKFDLHTEASFELTDSNNNVIGFDLLVTCFASPGYNIQMQFDTAIVTFSLFDGTTPEVRTSRGQRAYVIADTVLQDYPRHQYDVAYVFWRDFLTAVNTRTPNYTSLCSSVSTTQIIEQLYG